MSPACHEKSNFSFSVGKLIFFSSPISSGDNFRIVYFCTYSLGVVLKAETEILVRAPVILKNVLGFLLHVLNGELREGKSFSSNSKIKICYLFDYNI